MSVTTAGLTDLEVQRHDWSRCLLAADRLEVLVAAREAVQNCAVVDLDAPAGGLALVELEDGAFQEPFFLGEVPMSACRLLLTELVAGRSAQGGAVILRDDAELSWAIAVLDAVLAEGWESGAKAAALIAEGWRRVEEERLLRLEILDRTRVEFSLLEGVPGEV